MSNERPPLTPEEEELRRRLLPLARIVGANVYGETDPNADPHFALTMLDGGCDALGYIQGALDGLEVAVELGLWELKQVGDG